MKCAGERTISVYHLGGFLFVSGSVVSVSPSSRAGLATGGLLLIDTGASPMWVDAKVASDLGLCIVRTMPVLSSSSIEDRAVLSATVTLDSTAGPYEFPEIEVLPCMGLSDGFAYNPKMIGLTTPVIGALGINELCHFDLRIRRGVASITIP